MRREEWVNREIRQVVQGAQWTLGVGTPEPEPVSPLMISQDRPPEEPPPPAAPPAPASGTRRAARRKHKHAKR